MDPAQNEVYPFAGYMLRLLCVIELIDTASVFVIFFLIFFVFFIKKSFAQALNGWDFITCALNVRFQDNKAQSLFQFV